MCLMINGYKVEGTIVKTQSCTATTSSQSGLWQMKESVSRPSHIQNTSNSNWKPIPASRQNFKQGKKNSDWLLNLLSKSTKNCNWRDSLICHCTELVFIEPFVCLVSLSILKIIVDCQKVWQEKQQSKFCKGSLTDKTLTNFVCSDYSNGGRMAL